MNICNCALPAINGNSDCCKICPNRIEGEVKSNFHWSPVSSETELPYKITTGSIDLETYYKHFFKTKPMIDVVKENIEGLTIKELKELIEYMKKFEGLKC